MPIAPDLSGIALEDRYELHAPIGEGAFGRVYRGLDRRLDRPVAVKVIKPWWADEPEWVATFEREARMLARVSDPGIVRIYDVGRAPEGLYYVSELVEGENLAQRLDGGPIEPDQAREIAMRLCRALAGAHAERIVHRDVKPANVLLGRDGQVKIGDFGVARLAEGSSVLEGSPEPAIVGTPKYMAPEQGRGLATSPATDVYSAGVVLYEMLAGRPPFASDSAVGLALAHLHDPPPPLPAEVPEALAEIVSRALAKDPHDRYADAGAMEQALAGARVPARELVGAAAGSGVGAAGAPPRHPPHRGSPSPGARPDPGLPTPSDSAPEPTRPAPRRAPRVTVNPSARRRTVAALTGAVALLAALAAAAVLTGGHHGRRARAATASVGVPLVVGEDATDARARLRQLGLRSSITQVPAPGIRPGTVTDQVPVAGHTASARSLVRLSVSEVPRWRTVTTFAARSSVAFRIRGARWRILTTVSHARHCTLFLFCSGSSAQVLRAGSSAALESFGLSDGSAQTRSLATGPGVYEVRVDPASGDTRWSLTVQDRY